jgi:hypothetical protein
LSSDLTFSHLSFAGSVENVVGEGNGGVSPEREEDEEGAGVDPMEVEKEESEGEGDDVDMEDEDGQEDDPVLNEYEADGFLVLDEDEGGGAQEVEGRKARRKEDRFIPLEEDDLELIGEKKKSVKRLKRKGAVESDKESQHDEHDVGEGEEVVASASSQGRRRTASQLEEQNQEEEQPPDEDDDGFIIGGKRGRASQSGFSASANRVTDNQLAEWQAIFGDDKGEDQFVPDGDYVPEGEVGFLEQSQSASQAAAPARRVPDVRGVSSLQKTFDPALLASQFLTKRDVEIEKEDVPERLQLRIPNRASPEEGELDVEANWCLSKYVKKNPLSEAEQTIVLHKIFYLLHFIRHDQNEVPFVYQYRVDDLFPLTEDDCWDVYDWDEEWHRLTLRKRQLIAVFGDAHEMVRLGAEERYVQLIAAADTEEDLRDLAAYFQLNFSQKLRPGRADAKRPTTQNIVMEAKQEGYDQLAASFAITAAQLGENMWNNQVLHTPADIGVLPEQAVAEIALKLNQTPEAVLAMCRELLAQQVADDP